MARYNNKKLQTQRNFQSIWHSQPEYISTLLKEDQLIREYIIGTMKAKGWKLSEIIIKRKVKQIHIAFQIQNKIVKERKRWTKNRLKNRNKALGLASKRSKIISGAHTSLAVRTRLRRMARKKRFLFFQIYLMITELRKMYPNNQITFYVQKTKPLQLNANLINSWIIENIKKKRSHKRLLNKVISKFRKAQNTDLSKPISLLLKEKNDNKNLLSWVTGNLVYLYNVQKMINKNQMGSIDLCATNRLSPSKELKSNTIKSLNRPKRSRVVKFGPGPKDRVRRARPFIGNFAPIWWRLRKKWAFILWPYKTSWYLKEKENLMSQSRPLIGKINKKKEFLKAIKVLKFNKGSRPKSQGRMGVIESKSNFLKKAGVGTCNKRHLNKNTLSSLSNKKRSMSTITSKAWQVSRENSFNGLNYSELAQVTLPNVWQSSPLESNLKVLSPKEASTELASGKPAYQTSLVDQELRSTWKLMRKVSRSRSLKGRRKRDNIKQRLSGVIKHRKEFNEDILLLSNYYKVKYLLSLTKSLRKKNLKNANMATDFGSKEIQNNFLWQGMKFIKFIQQHPALLDHIIKCLISNYSSHVEYLTRAWVGIFDYIHHNDKSLLKGQGIKIILSGRVGYQKMGRAKRYSRYWGSLKNSSARLPLQYSYSQLHTRYGVVGVKVFVR